MRSKGPKNLLTMIIFLVLCPQPRPTWSQELRQFEGIYFYAGGDTQKKQRNERLDALIHDVNPLIRPIARRKLPKTCPIPPRVTIAFQGQELSIALAPAPPRKSLLDSTPTRFKNTRGDPVVMHRKLRGNTIIETLVRGRSRRILTYRLSKNASFLHIRWKIESAFLPRSVEYPLTYRRKKNSPSPKCASGAGQ